jgi:hypothetical protein
MTAMAAMLATMERFKEASLHRKEIAAGKFR